MATDKKNYEVVQISDADWGIQYSDGSLTRGFSSRQEAIDNAILRSEQPSDEASTKRVVVDVPKNLDEALVAAQSARDNYREFVGNNPSASQEQKDAQAGEIIAADAFVSQYQIQQAQTQKAALKADEQRRALLDFNEQVANAETRRNTAANEAVLARQNASIIGYTPEDIQQFDNKAFEAETYFESLKNQQKQASAIASLASSENSFSSLFSGGVQEFVNFGSSLLKDAANASGNSVTNTLDSIKNVMGNDFGSINSGGLTSTSTNGGYGSSTYSGTTVYDTSVGVTSVASSADQRIKISPKPTQRSAILTGVLEPLAATGGLVFPYTPSITLQGNTNYNPLEPVHSNQDYQVYMNTPSVDVTISGVFTAQNETEAKYLLACLHFLRVFTKMHFGNDSNAGLPPPQLLLDGYGTYMFNGLSVILRNFETSLSEDVDYVTVNLNNGTSKVPTLTTISVMLTVQQTPQKAKTFNWDSFAKGDLMQQKGWI